MKKNIFLIPNNYPNTPIKHSIYDYQHMAKIKTNARSSPSAYNKLVSVCCPTYPKLKFRICGEQNAKPILS